MFPFRSIRRLSGAQLTGLVGVCLLLTGCGSTKTNWFARAYQNTHALFNGYYHADLRYREAVKTAERQYIPPAEGFIPLVDGTDGTDLSGGGAPTLSPSAPLAGVPLPSLGSGLSTRAGAGQDPSLAGGQPGAGGQFGGQPGGQPGGFNPNAPGGFGAQDPGAGGVSSIPPPSAQRGPQASLFGSDAASAQNWGPGGSQATTPKALLDETMRKCEYMIFRRSRSNWVDDARLLMGKAAFQQRNYGFALQNFEFLLANYPKSELVPQALLWQAKVYYQFDNSISTRSLLQRALAADDIDRQTRVQSALLLAQLLTRDGEYNRAISVLDDNLDQLRGKKDKCRVNFLLGQLYDQRGNFSLAFDHYSRAAKTNYSTLMTFRSQLALVNLQVKYQPDVERGNALRRELAKMAKQGRFAEFHDQIEHQLALQEFKEKDYPEAEGHFKAALAKNDPTKNPLQRTTTYYELGKLYFDRLHRLDRAQAYFDSAARAVKDEFREARRIRAVAASLRDYVRYTERAAEADSLLRLGQLSEGELARAIDEAIEQEDERKEIAAALEAQRAEAAATAARNRLTDATLRGPADPTGLGLGEFYFDNAAQVERGKGEFTRVWGPRPNADNWRRRSAVGALVAVEAPDSADVQTALVTARPVMSRSERRAAARKNVPRDSSARAKLTTQLADARYGLAQVFGEQLQLPDSAIRIHREILDRFGEGSDVAPRSLYALYRLYSAKKDAQGERFADRLIDNFPNSPFARLIRQQRAGSTLMLESGDFESGYTAAFSVYTAGDHATVVSLSGFLLDQYADHPDAARLLYLRSMAYGHQGRRDSLLAGLERLIKVYPSHSLATQARETLAAFKTGVGPKAKLAPAPGSDPPRPADTQPPARPTLAPDADAARGFVIERAPNEKIFALVLVEQRVGGPDAVRAAFEAFNARVFASTPLSTSVFTTLDKHLVYISQFDSYAEGKSYLDRVSAESTLKKYMTAPADQVMLATATNFRLAFTQRRFADYLKFYQANLTTWLKKR